MLHIISNATGNMLLECHRVFLHCIWEIVTYYVL